MYPSSPPALRRCGGQCRVALGRGLWALVEGPPHNFPQYPPPPPTGMSSTGGNRKGANWTQRGPGRRPPSPPSVLLLPPRGPASLTRFHRCHHHHLPPGPWRGEASSGSGASQCCPRCRGHQRRVGETYPHTHNFSGNSSSEAGLWLRPLCTAAAAGCTQDNAPPSPAWRSSDTPPSPPPP